MGNYDWQTPSMDKANRSTIDARLKRLLTALPGRIVAFDAARQVASVQPMIEQQLMDGSRQALPLLPDPFFCINSDNIWLDGPRDVFHDLSAAWNADRMDALLAMVPHRGAHNYRGEGDFRMDTRGRLTRRRSGRIAPFIFSGIQLVSHRLLRDAPAGPFSTNILWDRAIDEGRLYGVAFTGQWFEVGTPQAIAPTEAALREA